MSTQFQSDSLAGGSAEPLDVSGSNRRTLDQVFHHPISRSLAWDHVVALVEHIGRVQERSNDNFIFEIGEESYAARKPHTHHLTAPEVMGVRHFLAASGWTPLNHITEPTEAKA